MAEKIVGAESPAANRTFPGPVAFEQLGRRTSKLTESALNSSDRTGLILAGGNSRRFGSDKAMHRFRGKPMIEHVRRAVRPLVAELLVSVQSRDDAPRDVSAAIVEDRFTGCGPLAGIHAGLLASSSPWLVVAPCDMPYLTSADLEKIVESSTDGAAAVVAVDGAGRRHPLCACYHRSLIPYVEQQLTSGNYMVRGLLDKIRVVDISLRDRALRNVNTVSDLLS